jgi:hypothetical protein
MCISASDSGLARGLCLSANALSGLVRFEVNHQDVSKQDASDITLSCNVLPFSRRLTGQILAFDGYRGRLCLTGDDGVEVLDFA